MHGKNESELVLNRMHNQQKDEVSDPSINSVQAVR